MLRLHHSVTSPFVRKVTVLLHETGLIEDVVLVPAGGTPVASGGMPLAQNPLGKIPVLERPDGPALYDSRVICRFLADLAGSGLYPPAPRLWETLTLEATADGIGEAAVLMRYEEALRPPEGRLAAWTEGQWAKVARADASGALYVLDRGSVEHVANAHFLRMDVKAAGTGFGISNEGFRGIGVSQGATYTFSARVRRVSGSSPGLRVEIEDASGRQLGAA